MADRHGILRPCSRHLRPFSLYRGDENAWNKHEPITLQKPKAISGAKNSRFNKGYEPVSQFEQHRTDMSH
ncbi:MAG: hypothetical protein WBC92_05035 [Terracidiphilus sp.]